MNHAFNRSIIVFAAILIALLATGHTARAQSSNAALYYWRAFWQLNAEKDRIDAIVNLTLDNDRWIPDEEGAAALRAINYVVDSLLRASRMPECDFALDYELGMDMLLPHLQPFRRAAVLLELDARRSHVAGDVDAAAERLGAIFRMAHHAAQDGTLISSLIAVSMFSLGHEALRRYDDIGAFDHVSRAILREALGVIDANDPFGIRHALHRERVALCQWFRRIASAEDAVEQVAGLLGIPADADPRTLDREVRQVLDRLRRNVEIDGYVDLLDAYYLHMLAAWDKPDAQESLRRLEHRMERGFYGPLPNILAPALTRVRATCERAESAYRDARDRVGG